MARIVQHAGNSCNSSESQSITAHSVEYTARADAKHDYIGKAIKVEAMSKKIKEPVNVPLILNGFERMLSNGNKVFLGKFNDNSYILKFTNDTLGLDQVYPLTKEATGALAELCIEVIEKDFSAWTVIAKVKDEIKASES